jgi:hypothetical protein
MLTFFVPLLVYLLSYPVMFITLSRVEVGLLFFITFVPIIAVMKKIVEFPNGHNMVDLLLVAMVLGWFFRAGKENRKLFVSSPINFAVILLAVGSLINLIRGYTYMDFSAETNLTRLMAWKNYMILPVLYFVTVNNVDKEKTVKWIIICISLTMLAMVFNFYSTFRWFRAEHYSDSIRISGPFVFLGPNEMGIFFAMYSFLLLGISYFIENRKLRYLMLFSCACSLYPILFSYSRSAYTCTLVGLVALAFLKDRRIFLVLVLLLLAYRLVLPTSIVERIDMTFLNKEEISQEQEQASAFEVGGSTIEITGRKHLWVKALNYFEQQPILGIGFDTFRHREGWITHSMYMKILAEQGLVGLTIFVVFIGIILRQGYRLFRQKESTLGQGVGLGFLLSVIVHLVGSASGDQSLYYNLMAIFWLFMGIVASFNIRYTDVHQAPRG